MNRTRLIKIMSIKGLAVVAWSCIILLPSLSEGKTGGISPVNRYAWSESAQWVNFNPLYGEATVEEDHLSGYVWAENLGWIKLGVDKGGPYANTDASNWGVNRAGNGDLSGYAWSEAGGWIRFNTDFSRVIIDTNTGDFEGYVWSERLGWIHLRNDQAGYGVSLETEDTVDIDLDGDGFSVSELDCDDNDPNTYPGAPELCDGKDNNCDGQPSRREKDADLDGWAPCMGDCEDKDPDTHPGAPELCDGKDNDCDGAIPESESDDDGDRYRLCDNDCDDQNEKTYPGAYELLDGMDNDCDGAILPGEMDEDGDKFLAFDDCDDHDPNSYPGLNCKKVQKAIIVAGGGPYPGNYLWSATRSCAVRAYSALRLRRFMPEDIYYLSADDAFFDDPSTSADDYASRANLEKAITEWAPDPSSGMTWTGSQKGFVSDVLIYLVDHGGPGCFRINKGEILLASDLDIWLAQLQGMIRGRVILIIDACNSGSFLSALNPPDNGERIVITSSSDDETAYFITNGAVSFSNYFWTRIMLGANVKDAFDNASKVIGFSTQGKQEPQLDDNGDHAYDDDHDGAVAEMVSFMPDFIIPSDAPVIGNVRVTTDPVNQEFGIIVAQDITYTERIKRVWATIWPPEGYSQTSSNRTVIRLPEVTLTKHQDTNYYLGFYYGFNIPGPYQINVYAMDDANNISLSGPPSLCPIYDPQRHCAIILAGDTSEGLMPAESLNVELAYNALTFQGYRQEDIYFLCPNDVLEGLNLPFELQGHYHHGPPSWEGLMDVNDWVKPQTDDAATLAEEQTRDLVLYMIGEGDDRVFHLNPYETITAQELGGWLNDLQEHILDMIIVIYDASSSGSFLPFLIPPEGKKRIIITSTWADQPANFLHDGILSFSATFWSKVFNGANLRDVFRDTYDALGITFDNTQVPVLDDTGDGVFTWGKDGRIAREYTIGTGTTMAGDEPIFGLISPEQDLDGNTLAGIWGEDGRIAQKYTIGLGIALAGDEPVIGAISPEQDLDGGTTAGIWVDVTTTGQIERIWGIITPPGYNPPSGSVTVTDSDMELATVELNGTGEGRYSGTYDGFSRRGPYTITVYAMDVNNNLSLPKQTTVYQYGDDDTPAQASVIFFCDPYSGPQGHRFNTPGDQDWVRFYGLEGEVYEIVINREVESSEWIPYFEIYESDGLTLADISPPGSWPCKNHLVWTCPATGVYYIKTYNSVPGIYGADTRYELSIFRPIADIDGIIKGVIRDALSGSALEDANIRVWIEGRPGGGSALSRPDGSYMVPHESGPCSIQVVKTGYRTQTREILVKENIFTIEDFNLEPFDIHLLPGLNHFDPGSIRDPYNIFDPGNFLYPEGKRKSITSFGLLSFLGGPDTVSAISRFNSKTGCCETTLYFMGRPSGIDSPIIRTESCLIYMMKEKEFCHRDLLQ